MADTIHQCDVSFTDGTSTFFVSADGQLFFEHGFPEKGARTSPMKYTREWLKSVAQSNVVELVEFTEREAVRQAEVKA